MKSSSLRIFHDGFLEIVFCIGDELNYKAVAHKMLEIGNESFASKYLDFY